MKKIKVAFSGGYSSTFMVINRQTGIIFFLSAQEILTHWKDKCPVCQDLLAVGIQPKLYGISWSRLSGSGHLMVADHLDLVPVGTFRSDHKQYSPVWTEIVYDQRTLEVSVERKGYNRASIGPAVSLAVKNGKIIQTYFIWINNPGMGMDVNSLTFEGKSVDITTPSGKETGWYRGKGQTNSLQLRRLFVSQDERYSCELPLTGAEEIRLGLLGLRKVLVNQDDQQPKYGCWDSCGWEVVKPVPTLAQNFPALGWVWTPVPAWGPEGGFHTRLQKNGTIQAVAWDGEYEYEVKWDGQCLPFNWSYPDLLPVLAEGLANKRATDVAQKLALEASRKTKEEALVGLPDTTVVSVSDSLAVGNCQSGTAQFMMQYRIQGDSITLGELKQHPEWSRMLEDEQFVRVLLSKMSK